MALNWDELTESEWDSFTETQWDEFEEGTSTTSSVLATLLNFLFSVK